eukprot:TRINITY_DN4680_c0_g1_i4.p1 TRINITY_DN4680_c0_g1~~TRINITY_DN4680_c0_g1_i4.p1  ORF type:complete len:465 (-),score=94.08 TRINITY_DN4680_c0_g1_i4:14-1408(-)
MDRSHLACYPVSVEGDDVVITASKQSLATPLAEHKPTKRDPNDTRIFVVLGGGAAGSTAVETLRSSGFTGRLVLITCETHLPYDRTKLSKTMNITDPTTIVLRSLEFYSSIDVEIILGAVVTELDSENNTVTFSKVDGVSETLVYTAALIATGGTPNKLTFIPGHDAQNVYVLRNPEDALNIYQQSEGKNVVIIGSSFIGMEVAASLSQRSSSVTVVGMEAVPFQRVLGLRIGQFMRRLHESAGITFYMDNVTKEFKVVEGKVASVVLRDGTELPADLVVLGAGIHPNLSFIKETPTLSTRDRCLHVDQYLRTSVPGLYAAGDVAAFPLKLTGCEQRIEHWSHAQNQGKVAAKNMLSSSGAEFPFTNIPFFWTTQYGKSLRYVGRTTTTVNDDSLLIRIQGCFRSCLSGGDEDEDENKEKDEDDDVLHAGALISFPYSFFSFHYRNTRSKKFEVCCFLCGEWLC